MAPKVTVYVPSHNKGKYLQDAIESVLRQTYDDWELLVINDNSSDNTEEVLKYYQGDPRIRFFSTPGIGLPAVSNLAITEARGEYIIRLDGDDYFEGNILLVLANHLDKNPDCSLVFSDYYLVDENNEVLSLESRKRVFQSDHMLDVPPNGACNMVRKSVLEEIEGYREDLGVQDGYDLWTKIKNDYFSDNINLPLFYYRRHSSNVTNNTQRILSAHRTIKKDVICSSIDSERPIIAVVPCRQNYDFRPNLWRESINGNTLLEHVLAKLTKSDLFDHIVVTSDTEEVIPYLDGFDDPRISFMRRSRQDTLRSTSITKTLQHVVRKYDAEGKGITGLYYTQSPFVSLQTMEEAIHTLICNDADSAIGVQKLEMPVYQRNGHGLRAVNPPREFRTDFDTLYYDPMTIVTARNKGLLRGSLNGPKMACFQLDEKECVFVNSERWLEIAKTINREQI